MAAAGSSLAGQICTCGYICSLIHSYKRGASGVGRYKGDHVSKYLVHSPPHTGTPSEVTLGCLTWEVVFEWGPDE